MYYVYILTCGDGSLYTGITNNLSRRVKAHSRGRGAKYTRSHLPVSLSYFEEAPDKSAALKRELAIKALSHGEKLALIQGTGEREPAERLGEIGPGGPQHQQGHFAGRFV